MHWFEFDTVAFSVFTDYMKMFAIIASPLLQDALAALTQKIICLAQYLEALPLLLSMHVNMQVVQWELRYQVEVFLKKL
jgi:hypothetical protein